MKLKLKNGKYYEVLSATGETKYIMGSDRDVIALTFNEETLLDEIIEDFTEANCDEIVLIDGEAVGIHTGYVIMASITKKQMLIKRADEAHDAEYVWRVVVELGQRTYSETQLAMIRRVQEEQAEVIAEMAFGGEM